MTNTSEPMAADTRARLRTILTNIERGTAATPQRFVEQTTLSVAGHEIVIKETWDAALALRIRPADGDADVELVEAVQSIVNAVFDPETDLQFTWDEQNRRYEMASHLATLEQPSPQQ